MAYSVRAQDPTSIARFFRGDHQKKMLGRDVLVRERGGLLLGLLQDPDELLGGADVGHGVAAELGKLPDRLLGGGAHLGRIAAEALQHGDDDAVLLVEQGEQEVGRGHLGVGVLGRDALSARDGLLGLDREPVLLHALSLPGMR